MINEFYYSNPFMAGRELNSYLHELVQRCFADFDLNEQEIKKVLLVPRR